MIGHSVLVIHTKEKQMLIKRALTTHLKIIIIIIIKNGTSKEKKKNETNQGAGQF